MIYYSIYFLHYSVIKRPSNNFVSLLTNSIRKMNVEKLNEILKVMRLLSKISHQIQKEKIYLFVSVLF